MQLGKIYENFTGEQLANYIHELFGKVMTKEVSLEDANEYAKKCIEHASGSWSKRKPTGYYKAEVVEESREYCDRTIELLLEDLEKAYNNAREIKITFNKIVLSLLVKDAQENPDEFFDDEVKVNMLMAVVELKEKLKV